MDHDKHKKKMNKGGEIVRFEPQGLQLIDLNLVIRESFVKDGCIIFCENLQGGHMEVKKQFSLNYDGNKTRVRPLDIMVSENTIATTIEIPMQGGKWFKGMNLDSSYLQ
jgi:hypothetical protein